MSTAVEVSQKPPVLFKQIKSDYEDGQIVFCIAGTITSLFPVKKGDTYEYQNGKMKDSAGEEIDICFSKNTQPDTAKGKKVTIRAVKTEKHGWNGIKVEDQKFTPQGEDEEVTKRVLKITATAEIIYDGGGGKAAGKGDAPSGKTAGASGGGQSRPAPQTHPRLFLQDVTALHKACYDAAVGTYGGQEKPDMELIHSCTATLFIEACRNGYQHNFIEELAKPLPPKITPAPADPKLWKECMIPKGPNMGKTLADLDEAGLTKYYDFYTSPETPDKQRESNFAKCVLEAFKELGYLAKREEAAKKAADENAALAPADDDDVPF